MENIKVKVLHKQCTKCKENKVISEFYFNITRNLYNSWCRKCHSSDSVERRKRSSIEHRQQIYRRQNLKTLCGITVEQYDEMHSNQRGLCRICKKPETAVNGRGGVRRLAVDHDKITGKVRGLLCGRCNMGIGNLCHSPKILNSAAQYLKDYG